MTNNGIGPVRNRAALPRVFKEKANQGWVSAADLIQKIWWRPQMFFLRCLCNSPFQEHGRSHWQRGLLRKLQQLLSRLFFRFFGFVVCIFLLWFCIAACYYISTLSQWRQAWTGKTWWRPRREREKRRKREWIFSGQTWILFKIIQWYEKRLFIFCKNLLCQAKRCVFWKVSREKNALLLDFVQMRGGGMLKFLATFS